MKARHGERLRLAEMRAGRMIVVLDGGALASAEQARLGERAQADALPIEVIDGAVWETVQRLAGAGLLQLADGASRIFDRAKASANADGALRAARFILTTAENH